MAGILIIEDNQTNMQLMAYLLRAFGHIVMEAVDGKTGLAVAERECPDLILCDLQMPGMDGYEVLRRIKQNTSLDLIPIVAVTAYAMVGDREKVLYAGFNGYIPKPINPEAFLGQVEVFLPYEKRSGPSNVES